MPLSQGENAPNFELPSGSPDNTIALSDYEGKENVVLLFFPLAFTGVCTDEMCTVSEQHLGRFNELNAEVLGISVNSPFTQEEWKQQEGIEFPLLSDFNRDVVTDYGVKREELLGLEDVANRAAFVIDRDGVIQYSWMTEDPTVLPDFDEIESVLEELS